MRAHRQFFVYNGLLQIEYRETKPAPLCLTRRDASTDMQHDISWSSCGRDRRSNCITSPWKVIMYMFRTGVTRGTRCCQNYYPTMIRCPPPPRRLVRVDLCSVFTTRHSELRLSGDAFSQPTERRILQPVPTFFSSHY